MKTMGAMNLWENTKTKAYDLLSHVETVVYMALGMLIAFAALLAIVGSIHLFGAGVRDLNGSAAIFLLIDRLLLVLVLVELMHSVRISIRSHTLVIEPFFIIGLIAMIRRTLVLTLQAEGFTKDAHWTADVEAHFRASMIEGGVLAVLLIVFAASIYIVRKTKAEEEQFASLIDPGRKVM